MVDGAGALPDSWREAVLALVLIPALVFAGAMVYVQANPGAPWQLEALYSNTFSLVADDGPTANESLVLPVAEAEYLNRVYRELNVHENDQVGEQAYCIDLVDGRVSVQQAGTVKASESSVRFTTANCFSWFGGGSGVDGLLHFHPPYSRPVLSGPETAAHPEMNDKSSFLSMSIKISCVMAGLAATEPGERTRALRCYMKPESGDVQDVFPEVPVVIGGET